MSDDFDPRLGWLDIPEEVARIKEYFESQGLETNPEKVMIVGAAGDEIPLNGFGAGKSVFLFDAERRINGGKDYPADNQARGICTSLGEHRAVQDTINNEIDLHQISEVRQIASEVIYGGARQNSGHGRSAQASPWGTPPRQVRGDGAVVSWGAFYLHDVGCLARGVYGPYDLSKPNEKLAIQFGNTGVPKELMDASAARKITAVHFIKSTSSLSDCVAAKKGVAIGCNTIWGPTRGAEGVCQPNRRGGHCQCIRGAFIAKNGARRFVWQQSWSDDYPNGPNTFETQEGIIITLPPGGYVVSEQQTADALGEGECLAFGPPKVLWRPDKVDVGSLM